MITKEEHDLWKNPPKDLATNLSDPEINEKYSNGEGRIVVENNREKLPGFYQQLLDSEYMDLRPFYQRRPRWEPDRQSRLIESFLINLPVPPIFLYERNFNSYEVMDGQQRITAIKDFFSNQLKLKGLQYWPELNGRTYETLPRLVRSGIDRRSISSIVMLKESAPEDEDAARLREIVFERLNTGGIELERQEIRNALYNGPFNEMLLELSRHNLIRKVWGIPAYHPDEMKSGDKKLLDSNFFRKMEDAELVLRFFALRNVEHYTRGMQGFLDLYMGRASKLSESTLTELRILFDEVMRVVSGIYGDLAFQPFDVKKDEWSGRPQKAFFDAVTVAISRNLAAGDILIQRKGEVIEQTKELFRKHEDGTFTGRKNSKKDIQNRIDLFAKMLGAVAA
ncbi:DUF262 domain-containing protein [Oceanicola sp. D3]|uniref:DUF262 domain-containing protein n=1 Tax=Oceanicola sp. D3 TaxID=2587163 RepID=UPI00111EBCBA|nr:DUF262 domain-containing protein [Oceanicola sp. D3]QDC10604.1 DUF262 domain-containing protein [Oceanicola sp. D3]